MRRLILIALAATALSAPALAGDSIQCRYTQWYGVNCTRAYTPPPRELTKAEIAAKEAEVSKWEAFCKPTKTYDHDGIGRLTYAQPGCEFGRSE